MILILNAICGFALGHFAVCHFRIEDVCRQGWMCLLLVLV
jgi:hypothetical protein